MWRKFFKYLNTHDYAYFIFWSIVITLFICVANYPFSQEFSWQWWLKHFFIYWYVGIFMSFYFHWRRKIGRPVYKGKKQIT